MSYDIGSCVICGLKSEALRPNGEQLMSVLLDWWCDGPMASVTGPNAAMDDMKALLRHIEDNGFAIVRCLPLGAAGAHDATTADEAKN